MQVLFILLSVTISLSLGGKLPFGGTKNFNIQQRIYNGEDAQKGQFPYIVSLSISLSDDNGALCGGSIIDHTWILTAAHCTHKAKSIKIFYGSTKVAQGEFSHEVNTDNIIEHEHYDDDTLENDLALIRTPHVDYSELVNKVSLADRDNDYEGAWAVASGWGETYDNSATPENLQFADLQIKSKKDCWDAIGRESDNILCVSTSEGKTIGSGDSGGPLVTHDDPKLVGVSSFSLEADEILPAGFSRVSANLDWIREHTGLE
ncbi:serine protease 1-like [Drosophila nasuta]|uniref:serine protease 1-like n=1 Tax=Drosophila nasuta TaxID=42062 RepID=UPI00295EF829|nr:serine protease 1-like [Drosophila nasuta]